MHEHWRSSASLKEKTFRLNLSIADTRKRLPENSTVIQPRIPMRQIVGERWEGRTAGSDRFPCRSPAESAEQWRWEEIEDRLLFSPPHNHRYSLPCLFLFSSIVSQLAPHSSARHFPPELTERFAEWKREQRGRHNDAQIFAKTMGPTSSMATRQEKSTKFCQCLSSGRRLCLRQRRRRRSIA